VEATTRTIHPWAVVRAHQHVYVIGWCTVVTDVRVFRLDRIVSVTLDGATFDVPPTFDLAAVLRDGRVFSGERPDDVLVVRYSPVVARWIAEREAAPLDPDGSVTISWPLADDDWAVRHVLQYGPDATVISPPRIRAQLVERLQSLLAGAPRTSDEQP
jgi:proteasome accessory factor C